MTGRARTSILKCGNARAGLRHMRARGHIASMGYGERTFLWSIAQTLSRPGKLRLQDNQRYRYDAPIEVYRRNGGVWYKDRFDFTVITTKRAGFIVTAYATFRGTVPCPGLAPC